MWSPVPERVARRYLDYQASRILLILVNGIGFLLGLNYYLEQLRDTAVWVWPVVMDSPGALALLTASLLTLAPFRRVDDYPDRRFLRVLNTLAFVGLVKYAAWTALTLNLFFSLYYPDPWSYFGILFTHLVMLFAAFLLPYYAKTDRVALGLAGVYLFGNDLADYLLGYHPHLRTDQLGPLPALTVLLSALCLALAAVVLDRA